MLGPAGSRSTPPQKQVPSFTIGIEEEYFLVERATRDLVRGQQVGLIDALKAALGDQVAQEFLSSQIEVCTPVCPDVRAAATALAHLRRTLVEAAGKRGLALLAASTHPFARWSDQDVTDAPRYHEIQRDLAGVGSRLSTCGMHVHVGIESDDLRIGIMNQVRDFLPLLLALSASSPFWQGDDTGLKSFRLAVTDSQPRSGLPETFDTWRDYQRAIEALCGSGAIDDATKIWWDLRPSQRFPTLELRITDICTRLSDAVTLAALFACICRMLYRLQRDGLTWHAYPMLLLNENRWRAQRYGIRGTLIDYSRGKLVPCSELVEELLALIEEDACALGCTHEVARALAIVEQGSSADRQVRWYRQARTAGAGQAEAMRDVVDGLVAETAESDDPSGSQLSALK